jgi:hypothetical protein
VNPTRRLRKRFALPAKIAVYEVERDSVNMILHLLVFIPAKQIEISLVSLVFPAVPISK